jgi:hypothetical protein
MVLFESSLKRIAMDAEKSGGPAHVAIGFFHGKGDKVLLEKFGQIPIAAIGAQKLLENG